ncbi:mannitol-1-phosphate 5-dehydrogenase, partial [Candidatus Calescamantes bacterium]|nr:mannitol-1-phosphate 5-dehydrogenase [Candidatus Calescamantes bacterium]
MKKAVQFGAGNIGRGFLADLFTASGYQVVFIEVNEKLVEELKRRG